MSNLATNLAVNLPKMTNFIKFYTKFLLTSYYFWDQIHSETESRDVSWRPWRPSMHATLNVTLSVHPSVGPSICPSIMLEIFAEKLFERLHCPYPPVCNWCCHVYGLVYKNYVYQNIKTQIHPKFRNIESLYINHLFSMLKSNSLG